MSRAQPQEPGRDRILAAAIDLFGARGVDATTVRAIAAAADVSPALVLHHFGSKAGLREAADAQVMATLAQIRAGMERSAAATSRGEDERFGLRPFMALVDNPRLAAYVRRILVDGGDRTVAILGAAHAQASGLQRDLIAQGVARPTEDIDTRAAVLMSIAMSLLILHEPLGEVIGYDPLTEDGLDRWLAQMQQLVTRGFLIES